MNFSLSSVKNNTGSLSTIFLKKGVGFANFKPSIFNTSSFSTNFTGFFFVDTFVFFIIIFSGSGSGSTSTSASTSVSGCTVFSTKGSLDFSDDFNSSSKSDSSGIFSIISNGSDFDSELSNSSKPLIFPKSNSFIESLLESESMP